LAGVLVLALTACGGNSDSADNSRQGGIFRQSETPQTVAEKYMTAIIEFDYDNLNKYSAIDFNVAYDWSIEYANKNSISETELKEYLSSEYGTSDIKRIYENQLKEMVLEFTEETLGADAKITINIFEAQELSATEMNETLDKLWNPSRHFQYLGDMGISNQLLQINGLIPLEDVTAMYYIHGRTNATGSLMRESEAFTRICVRINGEWKMLSDEALIPFAIIVEVAIAIDEVRNPREIPVGGSTEIKMPNLVGMDYDAVMVQYGHFLLLNPTQEYSSEYPKGQIIRQSVIAGRDIRANQRIDVIVSMGVQLVELNNYEGGILHIDEVQTRLRRQGFSDSNIRIKYEENETVPTGYVIRTDPPANSMIAVDTHLTVYVSYGESQTTVPDLVGLTRTQAEERAKMFDVIIIFYEDYSDSVERGRIISQDISPMTSINKFSTIEVLISLGSFPVKTFAISHSVSDRITGDYILEHYINGVLQTHLTKTQNMGINKNINWLVEGTWGVHIYTIYITSVETEKRALFCEYEVDFTGDALVSRQLQLNSRIFFELEGNNAPDPLG
jgi:beta-lactam-binding protein with PASTA domain